MAFRRLFKKKKLTAEAFLAKSQGFYEKTFNIAPASLNQPACQQEETIIKNDIDYLNSLSTNLALMQEILIL